MKKRPAIRAAEYAPSSNPEKLPLTDNHKEYLAAIERDTIIFSCGPAGCGKTQLAAEAAAKLLRDGKIEKIVMVRPTITCGEDVGYLPGNMREKTAPFLEPILEKFKEMFSKQEIEVMHRDGVFETTAIGYMRGRTLKRSMIIIDEAQNCTYAQLRMMLTRLGYGSKMIINGDSSQGDLRSGGADLIEIIRRLCIPPIKGITVVKMTDADILRSPFIRLIEERIGNRDNGK